MRCIDLTVVSTVYSTNGSETCHYQNLSILPSHCAGVKEDKAQMKIKKYFIKNKNKNKFSVNQNKKIFIKKCLHRNSILVGLTGKTSKNPKSRPPPPPPPVLYQHLKIVSGPFFGVKIRGVLGVSYPQKTHERTLAPVLKVIFVFRFRIFRLCGEVLDVFLTLRTYPDPQFWGGSGEGGSGGGQKRAYS